MSISYPTWYLPICLPNYLGTPVLRYLPLTAGSPPFPDSYAKGALLGPIYLVPTVPHSPGMAQPPLKVTAQYVKRRTAPRAVEVGRTTARPSIHPRYRSTVMRFIHAAFSEGRESMFIPSLSEFILYRTSDAPASSPSFALAPARTLRARRSRFGLASFAIKI